MSLVDRTVTYREPVAKIIEDRIRKKGINGYSFVNQDEAKAIMEGTDNSPIAQVIRSQTDFSTISVVDVSFKEGKVTPTELTQLRPRSSKS